MKGLYNSADACEETNYIERNDEYNPRKDIRSGKSNQSFKQTAYKKREAFAAGRTFRIAGSIGVCISFITFLTIRILIATLCLVEEVPERISATTAIAIIITAIPLLSLASPIILCILVTVSGII